MNIIKIMIPKSLTIFLHQHNTVRQGIEIMANHGYTALPVLDENNCYVGCVTEGDFLRCIMSIGTTDKHVLEKHRIHEILRRDFCPALSIDAEEEMVIDSVLKQNFVPIVDGRNILCGIVTRRGLISYLSKRKMD